MSTVLIFCTNSPSLDLLRITLPLRQDQPAVPHRISNAQEVLFLDANANVCSSLGEAVVMLLHDQIAQELVENIFIDIPQAIQHIYVVIHESMPAIMNPLKQLCGERLRGLAVQSHVEDSFYDRFLKKIVSQNKKFQDIITEIEQAFQDWEKIERRQSFRKYLNRLGQPNCPQLAGYVLAWQHPQTRETVSYLANQYIAFRSTDAMAKLKEILLANPN